VGSFYCGIRFGFISLDKKNLQCRSGLEAEVVPVDGVVAVVRQGGALLVVVVVVVEVCICDNSFPTCASLATRFLWMLLCIIFFFHGSKSTSRMFRRILKT
jgi:hypothetical protein